MKARYLLLPIAGVLLAGCGSNGAEAGKLGEHGSAISLSDGDAHALAVYGNYQDAAGGKITFTVSTLKSGRVSDVMDRSVNELVGVPDYRITMQQLGTEITSVSLEKRDPATDEWANPVLLSKFDELGRSTSEATYQLLSIGVDRGGQQSEHRALQVCWAAEGYCLVMDPVVENLEAYAHDRAQMLAEGWKVESTYTGVKGDVSAQSVCTLASNFSAASRTLTWNARTISYYNVYGIMVVQDSLGGQQVGISCYVSGSSCLAAAFGYSNASSCFANVGFNCDCDNTGNQTGTSSNAARAWSETKCESKNVFQGSANVSWTKNGIGANFSITWATSGGTVNSNGGTLYDTCAWH